MPPATHGGSGARIDLSASLNPLGPSPTAIVAAREAALDRYPDPGAVPLRVAAAARHGLPERSVVPLPGASWALWFCSVALLQPDDRCVALGPSFSEYARNAAINRAEFDEVRTLEALETALPEATMCVLANPGNPDGRAIPAHRLTEICEAHPQTAFIVDEAFAAFAPPGTSLTADGPPPSNAVIVRSLTKELGLPGLRIGYAVVGEDLNSLAEAVPAWPLAAPDLAAAVAGLADEGHVTRGADVARRHVGRLHEALTAAGACPSPTDANYVLARAPGLHQRLAARGIAVRDCASFGLSDHVRIAAPRPSDLDEVVAAIEEPQRDG
jgi:histidinol-phosphate/aromatic aminotransferase/cobyric acid decarboxylase-like protein